MSLPSYEFEECCVIVVRRPVPLPEPAVSQHLYAYQKSRECVNDFFGFNGDFLAEIGQNGPAVSMR